eukprot:CAMPEP_0174371946 /NCGR_PEP_ID=MMETSP0811_2-20130205/101665_1 /TAXON_ID=73025 ORGANISM="Eutreptiella gymnastica-like, Strain CCMP1594" /NCGR_SAMPLE_ID=MMETSP0811_2 /ASSEMBLY_ACC=CAM_ASM_000667 /LENGTH=141 /DNA_ID=CAMNT_0015518845 /DNA_START=246 /DNA_END=668 /DNA_ORIENTATION=-
MFAAGAAHSATDIGGGQHLLKASGQYVTRGLHAAGGVLRELDLNIKLNFMLCKLCSMTGISQNRMPHYTRRKRPSACLGLPGGGDRVEFLCHILCESLLCNLCPGFQDSHGYTLRCACTMPNDLAHYNQFPMEVAEVLKWS